MANRVAAMRKLLEHERPDRRWAAAIVLAELRIKDKKTVKALIGALSDEEPQVRAYSLEALGAAKAVAAVDKIADLLADSDPLVRQAAEAAVIRIGDDAVSALKRLIEGPATVRRAAAAVLARLESKAGIEMLVNAVDGNDVAVLDRTRKALRDRASELTAKELRGLRKTLDRRLDGARRDGDDVLAAAVLQLLGDLPDETVVTRIMQETGPKVPVPVRRAALTALTGALSTAKGQRRDAAVDKILGYLMEDDEDGVTRPARHALEGVKIPQKYAKRLEGLLEAPSASVRAFALSQLGQRGTAESIEVLVNQLLVGPAQVRAAARDSLVELPDAAAAIARALPAVDDGDRQRELCALLRHHKKALPEKDALAMCTATIDRLEKGEEPARALADTLSRTVPEIFMEAVRARVKTRRRGKKLAEAWTLLTSVERCPAFGEEERFQLAVLGLVRSAETQARPPRPTDRICVRFAELLRSGFPIEGRLRKERLLQPRDLYHLGFAFSESRDEDEREFGHEMLEEVVSRTPRSKLGAASKNKLKLTQR